MWELRSRLRRKDRDKKKSLAEAHNMNKDNSDVVIQKRV